MMYMNDLPEDGWEKAQIQGLSKKIWTISSREREEIVQIFLKDLVYWK